MKEEKKNGNGLLGGTFALTLSTLIVKIIGVIYKMPLAAMLGDEGMGYFNSAYTVFSFFYLICTAGVPKAVMILSGEAKAHGRLTEERILVKSSLIAFTLLGLFVTLLLILLSPLLSSLIGAKRSLYTLIAVAPSILFVSSAGVLRGKLSSDMRFSDIAISGVIEALGRLLLGLIFAYIGSRLSLPMEILTSLTILGVTLGALFGLLYLYVCYKRTNKEYKTGQKEKIHRVSKRALCSVLKISLPITVSSAAMSLTGIIDLSMMMRGLSSLGYSEEAAAGLYGNYSTLAVSMHNLAVSLTASVSVAFIPVFTRLSAERDLNGFSSAVKESLRLSSFIFAPITVGLLFYPVDILSLLFPSSEVKVGASLLLALLPAVYFNGCLLTVNSALEAMGDARSPMRAMLIGSAMKVLLSFILLKKTDLGIFSVPIGTVVCYMAALLISLRRLEGKHGVGASILLSTLPSHIASFCAVILTYPLYSYMKKLFDGGAVIMITVLSVGVAYLLLCNIFGIFNRKKIKKLAKYTKIPL